MRTIAHACVFLMLGFSAACSSRDDAPEQKTGDPPAQQITGNTRPATPGNGHVLKFVKHQIMDRDGTGLSAATFLLPEGWSARDRLYWDYQNVFFPTQYVGQYRSNDGTLKIEYFANVQSVWSTGPAGTQGIPPPASVTDALKQFVRFVRKVNNLRFTGAKIIPGLRQPVQRQANAVSQTKYESGIVRVEFEQNNQTIEEEFYADLSVVGTASQGVVYLQSVGWNLLFISSCAAPKGRLEECRKIGLTVRSSSHTTLPFFNRYLQVTQLLQDQAYAAIYQAGQISRIISQTNDQVSKSISDSYWNTQKANDRVNQQFSDYVRGVDRYGDGGGTVYQLPSGYANAWVNNKGEYLLSDQAGFDPNVTFKEDWKPLQRK